MPGPLPGGQTFESSPRYKIFIYLIIFHYEYICCYRNLHPRVGQLFLALIAGCAIGMLRERKETNEEEFPFDAIIPAIAAAIVMHEKEKKESEGKENKEGTEAPEKPAE